MNRYQYLASIHTAHYYFPRLCNICIMAAGNVSISLGVTSGHPIHVRLSQPSQLVSHHPFAGPPPEATWKSFPFKQV